MPALDDLRARPRRVSPLSQSCGFDTPWALTSGGSVRAIPAVGRARRRPGGTRDRAQDRGRLGPRAVRIRPESVLLTHGGNRDRGGMRPRGGDEARERGRAPSRSPASARRWRCCTCWPSRSRSSGTSTRAVDAERQRGCGLGGGNGDRGRGHLDGPAPAARSLLTLEPELVAVLRRHQIGVLVVALDVRVDEGTEWKHRAAPVT